MLLITCLRREQNNECDKLFLWPHWPWLTDDRWGVRGTKSRLKKVRAGRDNGKDKIKAVNKGKSPIENHEQFRTSMISRNTDIFLVTVSKARITLWSNSKRYFHMTFQTRYFHLTCKSDRSIPCTLCQRPQSSPLLGLCFGNDVDYYSGCDESLSGCDHCDEVTSCWVEGRFPPPCTQSQVYPASLQVYFISVEWDLFRWIAVNAACVGKSCEEYDVIAFS